MMDETPAAADDVVSAPNPRPKTSSDHPSTIIVKPQS